jgi:hypothetical protein
MESAGSFKKTLKDLLFFGRIKELRKKLEYPILKEEKMRAISCLSKKSIIFSKVNHKADLFFENV